MSGLHFTKQYGSVFYIYDYNHSFYKRIAEKDNNRQDEYNSATKQVSLTFQLDSIVAYFIKLYKN